tara:strand:- start:4481 stop:4627 length:147 start_codon:yes stop_codon:yes gene_type:complete
MAFLRKIWNIVTGKDLNGDGKVDIKDKLISAERKAAKRVYKANINNNE